jgi:YVTN family beta-propeller protein
VVPFRTALLLVVLVVAGTLAASSSSSASTRSGDLPLTQVADVRLPGHATRFDYQSADPAGRRLYVAHLGDSTLDVVDLDTLRVVATVPQLADVHGVVVAPERRRVYVTATGVNQLVTIDATTIQVVARVPTGSFPDGVAYDGDDGLVFVSNKNDGSITVVDATTNAVVDTIKLGDETGNVAYGPTTHTVYAAARTPDALVAIDPITRRITSRIRLPGCDGAHGVYLDTAAQRGFVACEHNARLVSVDLRAARENIRTSVGSDPDVLAFDVGMRRLYVASESGTVSVFDTSASTPRKLGQGHLSDAAHSVAVDQVTHRVFFPLENIRGHPLLRVTGPR